MRRGDRLVQFRVRNDLLIHKDADASLAMLNDRVTIVLSIVFGTLLLAGCQRSDTDRADPALSVDTPPSEVADSREPSGAGPWVRPFTVRWRESNPIPPPNDRERGRWRVDRGADPVDHRTDAQKVDRTP